MESRVDVMQDRPAQLAYPLGLEDSTELARATYQDRFLTRHMGGVFPELEDISFVSRILDVGCGPGGWALDVAHDYPKIEVVGIDLSEMMIEYASACARSQGMDNARFMVMDALQPLDFDDESFELLNARYASLFVPTQRWPAFIAECLRLTTHGGIIRLTEWERPITTSSSIEKLYTLFVQAQKQKGIGFSPGNALLATLPAMTGLLANGGCKDIHSKIYEMDFSASSEAHESGYLHFLVLFKILQPFLIQSQLISQEEFTELYQQALLDIMLKDFCSLVLVRTVWGRKP